MKNKPHNKPHIVAISQARMGSSRLPGKVLTPLHGVTLLEWHCRRMQNAKNIDKYVVATTIKPADSAIAEFCKAHNISCFRGDEANVFSRYLSVARAEDADILVRVTGDCPLIDPQLVDATIEYFLTHKEMIDYVSLDISAYARGFDVEVFSRSAFEKLSTLDLEDDEKEHVTLGLYKRKGLFKCAKFDQLKPPFKPRQAYRLCVDEPDDLKAVKEVLNHVTGDKQLVTWKTILEILHDHPEIVAINHHVEQVKVI